MVSRDAMLQRIIDLAIVEVLQRINQLVEETDCSMLMINSYSKRQDVAFLGENRVQTFRDRSEQSYCVRSCQRLRN